MTDINPDDIKAMRKEGSFRDFLRLQIADGNARKQPAKPAPQAPPPGHTPGAWPTGSQRPAPIPAQPPGAWATALERYADWLATAVHPEKPEPGQHCPCGCTPDTAKENQ